MIVGSERTGSNLLSGLLSSHPDVRLGGELLNPRMLEDGVVAWPNSEAHGNLRALCLADDASLVDELTSESDVRYAGFKLFYYHALLKPAIATRILDQDEDAWFVHLRRANLVMRAISILRARESDKWAHAPGEERPKLQQIYVPPDWLLKNLTETREREIMFRRRLPRLRTIEISYEEIAAGPTSAAQRLAEHLGLGEAQLQTRFRKSGSGTVEQNIENVDEVRETLDGTIYRDMLDA